MFGFKNKKTEQEFDQEGYIGNQQKSLSFTGSRDNFAIQDMMGEISRGLDRHDEMSSYRRNGYIS